MHILPTYFSNLINIKYYSYVNSDYSFYCDTTEDLYMQAYELIRSCLKFPYFVLYFAQLF